MINDEIRNKSKELVKYYEISFEDIQELTPKSFKIQDNNGNTYFLKLTNYNTYEKYLFLNNQGINNVLYPIKNNKKEYVTRLMPHAFYLNNYYYDYTIIKEVKFQNMFNELNRLHDYTKFSRQLNPSSSRPKFEEITNRLNYKFIMLENYVRSVEAKNLNIYSMPILSNYQYILDCKKELVRLQKRIISSVKAKETVEYSFIHNNPQLDHLIQVQGNNYLTSIDNGKIGIESLDLAKFYLENEDVNIDYNTLFLNKFKELSPFYYDYFRYLILIIYINRINLSTDEYVNAQTFINISNSLKKYFERFKDINDYENSE